jgi:MurNAc alpha-1-phosphate uridylyltransferase
MQPFPLMLFAAGFGTRMGALTRDRPKPLVPVAGRALLDYALDIAATPCVSRRVINLHYRGDQIAQHLQGQDIALSWEDPILDTGGGLRAALPLLGTGPVMLLNTDAVWTGANPLDQLAAAWDGARMDGLLLLSAPDQALGHKGAGDFLVDGQGRLSRAKGSTAPIYLGAQILQTQGLAAVDQQAFSLNVLWDQMIAQGRLYGVFHQGGWCDVGHPEAIPLAESLLHG